MNKIYLEGKLGNLYKLPEQETYKARLTTHQGSHRIYIPKRLINRNLEDYSKKIVAIIGHINQTLFDTEHIAVDQIAIFDSEESDI